MKQVTNTVCLALLASLLASCGSSGQGPNAWLDRPLDGSHFELEPIIFQAHASDADGVAGILFYVDGDPAHETIMGGGTLEEATYMWEPPAAGIYTVSARGIDSGRNMGPAASAVITVGDVGEPLGDMGPVWPSYYDSGGPAPSTPTVPRPSETPKLPTVTATATATVTRTPPPPTKTPTSPPPSPTMDFSPPSITAKYFTPSDYMVGGSPSGCDARRAGTSTIIANDPAGIWSVWADWVVGSQSGTVYYTLAEFETYVGQFGPFSGQGWLTINGRVNDNFGNYQPFTQVIEVRSCID